MAARRELFTPESFAPATPGQVPLRLSPEIDRLVNQLVDLQAHGGAGYGDVGRGRMIAGDMFSHILPSGVMHRVGLGGRTSPFEVNPETMGQLGETFQQWAAQNPEAARGLNMVYLGHPNPEAAGIGPTTAGWMSSHIRPGDESAITPGTRAWNLGIEPTITNQGTSSLMNQLQYQAAQGWHPEAGGTLPGFLGHELTHVKERQMLDYAKNLALQGDPRGHEIMAQLYNDVLGTQGISGYADSAKMKAISAVRNQLGGGPNTLSNVMHYSVGANPNGEGIPAPTDRQYYLEKLGQVAREPIAEAGSTQFGIETPTLTAGGRAAWPGKALGTAADTSGAVTAGKFIPAAEEEMKAIGMRGSANPLMLAALVGAPLAQALPLPKPVKSAISGASIGSMFGAQGALIGGGAGALLGSLGVGL